MEDCFNNYHYQPFLLLIDVARHSLISDILITPDFYSEYSYKQLCKRMQRYVILDG